ncbi:MAG: hypothetical protein AAGG02_11465 [Cyanobacteria bacterium P01_H01_bin.15]
MMTTKTITAQSLLFTRASAARILGIKPNFISQFHVFDDAVYLTGEFGERYLAKALFENDFAAFRRNGSLGLYAVNVSDNGFQVSASYRNKTYDLVAHSDHISCTCADYRQQVQAGLKLPLCKHGYAVLRRLEIESMEDYPAQVASALVNLKASVRAELVSVLDNYDLV